MCDCNRRRFIGLLVATPVALSGCTRQTEGPEEIRFGREICAMCGMIISDPRFAAEIRGGPDRALVKFDDIGDAVNWLEMQPWRTTQLGEFWVMNADNGTEWLDARAAWFLTGVVSPMDYGFAAVKDRRDGAQDFASMTKAALEKGVSSRCPPPGKTPS